jgi:hypothetical protein
MAYSKTTWVNGSTAPINATNLNKIESGIYDTDLAVQSAQGDITTIQGDVTTIQGDIVDIQNAIGAMVLDATETVNANTATSTGFYYAANTATNIPSAHAYSIIVSPLDATNLAQIAIKRNSTTDFSMYYRVCIANSWSAWRSVSGSTISASAPTAGDGLNGDVWYVV